MKTKQINKQKMHNAVLGVVKDHDQIWSGVNQLKNVVEKFEENNNLLAEFKTSHEIDLQPLIIAKADSRKVLINSAIPVLNIILAYAHDSGDKELLKKFNLSRNKLAKSKDLNLIENCKIIYKTASKLINKSLELSEQLDSKLKNKSLNIFSYGLSEKLMTDLETAERDFIENHLGLREAIQNKNDFGRQITGLIKENDKLLKNKMDLLISIFESSNPEFYKKYTEARVIEKVQKEKEPEKKSEKKSEKKPEKAKEKKAKKMKQPQKGQTE